MRNGNGRKVDAPAAVDEVADKELERQFVRECENLELVSPLMMFSASPTQWWSVLAAVQLACRHPGFDGPARRVAEDVARQIQARIAPRGAMAAVAEAGWWPTAEERAG